MNIGQDILDIDIQCVKNGVREKIWQIEDIF